MKASEQRTLKEGVDARRVSGSMSCSNQTDNEVSELAPLRSADAVTIAFPHGGMTVSGLRREIRRGRLACETIAGKQFTTLHHIKEMREKCRDNPRSEDSASTRRARRNGKLERHSTWVIRDGAQKIRTGRSKGDREGADKPSRNTSPENTGCRETADVIPLKSP